MGTTRSGGTGTPATRYLYMSACCSSSSYCAGVNGSGLAHLPLSCASSAIPPPPAAALPLHQHRHATTLELRTGQTNKTTTEEQRRVVVARCLRGGERGGAAAEGEERGGGDGGAVVAPSSSCRGMRGIRHRHLSLSLAMCLLPAAGRALFNELSLERERERRASSLVRCFASPSRALPFLRALARAASLSGSPCACAGRGWVAAAWRARAV
jgi:hypothetical protein